MSEDGSEEGLGLSQPHAVSLLSVTNWIQGVISHFHLPLARQGVQDCRP